MPSRRYSGGPWTWTPKTQPGIRLFISQLWRARFVAVSASGRGRYKLYFLHVAVWGRGKLQSDNWFLAPPGTRSPRVLGISTFLFLLRVFFSTQPRVLETRHPLSDTEATSHQQDETAFPHVRYLYPTPPNAGRGSAGPARERSESEPAEPAGGQRCPHRCEGRTSRGEVPGAPPDRIPDLRYQTDFFALG